MPATSSSKLQLSRALAPLGEVSLADRPPLGLIHCSRTFRHPNGSGLGTFSGSHPNWSGTKRRLNGWLAEENQRTRELGTTKQSVARAVQRGTRHPQNERSIAPDAQVRDTN